MNIRPTKTFAKYVDEFVKRTGLAEYADLCHVNRFNYPNPWDMESGVDYDPETNKYKVVSVFYPHNWYAPCLNITTPMLRRALRESRLGRIITQEDLDKMLTRLIEI